MQRLLSVMGMVLSAAALAVAAAAAGGEKPRRENPRPRLEDIRARARKLSEKILEEEKFLQRAREEVQRAAGEARGLEDAARLPAPETLRASVRKTLSANWDLFIHRYLLASGRIGVLEEPDRRRAHSLERLWAAALARHHLPEDQKRRASRILAETQLLYLKARRALRPWPGALRLEKERLIGDAGKRLGAFLPPQAARAAARTLAERLR